MAEIEDKRGPGLKFPPPLLVIALIGGAWLLDEMYGLPIVAGDHPWRSGTAVIALALLLALTALIEFIRSRTHVEPWQPTTTIIRRGVFRYSRNPIYLAFCIATPGAALVLNSWWIVCVLPLQVYLLQVLVIRREERYLEGKFGEEYLAYKRSVRRWL